MLADVAHEQDARADASVDIVESNRVAVAEDTKGRRFGAELTVLRERIVLDEVTAQPSVTVDAAAIAQHEQVLPHGGATRTVADVQAVLRGIHHCVRSQLVSLNRPTHCGVAQENPEPSGVADEIVPDGAGVGSQNGNVVDQGPGGGSRVCVAGRARADDVVFDQSPGEVGPTRVDTHADIGVPKEIAVSETVARDAPNGEIVRLEIETDNHDIRGAIVDDLELGTRHTGERRLVRGTRHRIGPQSDRAHESEKRRIGIEDTHAIDTVVGNPVHRRVRVGDGRQHGRYREAPPVVPAAIGGVGGPGGSKAQDVRAGHRVGILDELTERTLDGPVGAAIIVLRVSREGIGHGCEAEAEIHIGDVARHDHHPAHMLRGGENRSVVRARAHLSAETGPCRAQLGGASRPIVTPGAGGAVRLLGPDIALDEAAVQSRTRGDGLRVRQDPVRPGTQAREAVVATGIGAGGAEEDVVDAIGLAVTPVPVKTNLSVVARNSVAQITIPVDVLEH